MTIRTRRAFAVAPRNDLNTAATVATLRGLTSRFDIGVGAANPVYPEFCTVVPSSGADEQYGFLGAMPGVREWLGDREFNKLRAADFSIKNRTWENSVEIDREAIDDDRLGMYAPVFEELGREAAHHPDELLFEALMAGSTEACFDGQYFFDTDHSWGDSGSQANLINSTVTSEAAVTEAEFRTAYHAARAAMLAFKRDNGKPWIRPTIRPLPNLLLLVPPALEEVANQAINKQLVDAGETNIVLDKPRIMTCASYTSSVHFDLYNLDGPIKPYVFQARQPLKRTMKGMDDREHKGVKFMTDARYNVGYLAWWKAVRVHLHHA